MININLKALSYEELNQLEQQILVERRKRIEADPNTISVEPDAPQEAYTEAIQTILDRKV